jgi:Cu/Ag efflux protein CusF
MNTEQLKRFEASIVTLEDKHHEIAEYYIGAMTNKYRNTDTMSLDEFLCEYSDNMEYEDVKLGESILNLF